MDMELRQKISQYKDDVLKALVDAGVFNHDATAKHLANMVIESLTEKLKDSAATIMAGWLYKNYCCDCKNCTDEKCPLLINGQAELIIEATIYGGTEQICNSYEAKEFDENA